MPSLEPAQLLLLAAAALLAGAVNAVAGGGSLLSFPALLAVGYPAITANVTNSVALTPGYFGGTLGYRRELAGQRRRILALGATSATGAVVGAVLLLVSSPELFEAIVPFLIFLACGLLALQPRLARLVRARREGDGNPAPGNPGPGAPAGADQHTGPLFVTQFLAAVYGAYFGAGVGIMMLAILGIFLTDSLQRLNALKGLLSLVVAVVAAIWFALFADVAWVAAAVMAVASLLGGQLGVLLARRLNDQVLRWLVVAFGVAVGLRLLLAG
ncbi:MAG TPA: sulfite exporter TauE/SafE family protein [Actinomycetota bacterium]|nr:sulfite exporter TauE/SafE family protein [Actinomycetota bacterium]